MPRPKHDRFQIAPCLLVAADICMAQFMNVAGGQYPFDGRGDRARVARAVFCVGGKIRGDFAEMSVTSCYKIASGCYIFVTKCRGGVDFSENHDTMKKKRDAVRPAARAGGGAGRSGLRRRKRHETIELSRRNACCFGAWSVRGAVAFERLRRGRDFGPVRDARAARHHRRKRS